MVGLIVINVVFLANRNTILIVYSLSVVDVISFNRKTSTAGIAGIFRGNQGTRSCGHDQRYTSWKCDGLTVQGVLTIQLQRTKSGHICISRSWIYYLSYLISTTIL